MEDSYCHKQWLWLFSDMWYESFQYTQQHVGEQFSQFYYLSLCLQVSLAVLEITTQGEVLAYSTEVRSPLKVLFSVSFNWIQWCIVLNPQESVFSFMLLTGMQRSMVNPAIW